MTDLANTLEQIQLRELALKALSQWLSSENFKERAPWKVAWSETSLAKEVERRRIANGWQWCVGEEGQQLKKLVQDIQRAWLEYGWVRVETRRVGRPRTAEYDQHTLAKARRLYRDGVQGYTSDSTYVWAESVLGETTNKNPPQVIVIQERVHRELLFAVGEKELEGLTRVQIAELLGVSQSYTNRFVRWLLGTGRWKEVRLRDGESRERVLRRAKQ